MYLYKTRLTEAQIKAYAQPEGTRNPECGGGINCAFCALKMLDVYNKEFAEQGSNMCVPRYRLGDIIRTDEHIAVIQKIIKDVYGENHEFDIRHFPGIPNEILTIIASELGPSEACYLVYGNSAPAKGTHAVVFRRAEDGVLEMIDPQRGRKDEGTPYGITDKYAKELDDLGGRVDVTDNYYRVRGDKAIAFAMKAQSVAFGYWKTIEEFDREFARNPAVFTIGTLLIDSMIKTTKMELDEPAPPPSMKMEVDMQGGASKIPRETFAKLWKDHNDAIETQMNILIGKLGVNAYEEKNKALRLKEAFLVRIKDIEWESGRDIHLGPAEFIERFFLLGPAEIGAILRVKGDTKPDAVYEVEEEEEGDEDEKEGSDDKSSKTGSTGSKKSKDRVRKFFNKEKDTAQCEKAKLLGANVTDYCYICGFEIQDYKNPRFKGEEAPHKTRECEHILPAFTILGHGGLITKSFDEDAETPEIKAIFTSEYANSHRCCNQIKKASIWIKYDPTKQLSSTLVVDRKELSKTLREIAGSDKHDCKAVFNKPLSKEWVDRREEFIAEKVLEPLRLNIMKNMDADPEIYYGQFRYRQVKAIAGLTPKVLASVFLGVGDAAKVAAEALEQIRLSQKKYPAAKIGPHLKKLLIPEILQQKFQAIFKTMTVGISFDEILTKLRVNNPNMRAPRSLEKYLFGLLDKKKIASIVTAAINGIGGKSLNEEEKTTLVNKTGVKISSELIQQLKDKLGPEGLISESGVIVVENESKSEERRLGGGGDEELGNLDDAYDSLIEDIKEDIEEAETDWKAWLAASPYEGTRSHGPAPPVEVGVRNTLVLPEGERLEAGEVAALIAGEPTRKRQRTEGGGHIDISVHQGGRRVIEVDYV